LHCFSSISTDFFFKLLPAKKLTGLPFFSGKLGEVGENAKIQGICGSQGKCEKSRLESVLINLVHSFNFFAANLSGIVRDFLSGKW